jgi:hypothetical protein
MLRAIGFCAVLLASASSAQDVPEIRFDSVDFLKPPADLHLGEVAGVALGKAGQVYVFQRGNTQGPAYAAAAAQLLEFDANGRFVREIGHNLYAWSYAHATRVDAGGNIWVADKGSNMVIKFNPAVRVALVFGRKPEASDENARPLEHPKPPLPPAVPASATALKVALVPTNPAPPAPPAPPLPAVPTVASTGVPATTVLAAGMTHVPVLLPRLQTTPLRISLFAGTSVADVAASIKVFLMPPPL